MNSYDSTQRNRLIVVSFVGPSGSGKTSAMKQLVERYSVLEERYMELNRFEIDNQLVTSKWAYFSYWFTGIFDAQKKGTELILTDRCPLDCCAYLSSDNTHLKEVLKMSFGELNALNILHYMVLVTADFNILQARIKSRLMIESNRANYHEEYRI
jgi:hypothetical protein